MQIILPSSGFVQFAIRRILDPYQILPTNLYWYNGIPLLIYDIGHHTCANVTIHRSEPPRCLRWWWVLTWISRHRCLAPRWSSFEDSRASIKWGEFGLKKWRKFIKPSWGSPRSLQTSELQTGFLSFNDNSGLIHLEHKIDWIVEHPTNWPGNPRRDSPKCQAQSKMTYFCLFFNI